jgi:class 3 adenylate cyclase
VQLAVEGPVADSAAAWRCIADPEPFLRAAGFPPIRLRPTADEDGEVTLRAELLGPIGLRHEAEELRAGWCRGDRFWFAWKIRGPIFSGITFEAELRPAESGHRPRICLTLETWTPLVAPLVSWGLGMARRAWQRQLEALPAPGQREMPLDARHLDLSTEAALGRWADRQGDPALVGRVRRLLQHSPAWRLDRLCPGQLAADWDLPPQRVVDGLVSAVAAGVLGVAWHVHCPRCDALVERVPALSALAENLACHWCRAPVPLDLCTTVSAVLTVPLLVHPHEERHAAHTPARDPRAWALALVDGTHNAALCAPPEPGCWRIVGGADAPDGTLWVEEGATEEARWSHGQSTVRVRPGGRLVLEGSARRRHRLRLVPVELAPGAPSAGRVAAVRLLTHPGWRRVLGRPGLAPRVVAEVAELTVLFTDLTDTAGYYKRAGDRAALRFVQAQLAMVERSIQASGGVVVKTLGDGVMAAFSSPGPALAAAVDLLGGFDEWCRTQGERSSPSLRLGIAHGHALAMHTDAARLDLFGGTVNAAARAVSSAPRGTVQCTAELAADPVWQAAVQAHKAHQLVRSLPPEPETAPAP